MMFKDKNVLVVGAGKSGIAASNLLNEKMAHTILYDSSEALDQKEVISKLSPDFHGEVILKTLPDDVKNKLDYVVLSPGVPTDLPLVLELKEKGVIIIGEIELAYQFAKGKLAAITGTNGKTTTTTLTGEIMKTYYEHVFVVGNIGVPYTQMVSQITEDAVTVAEMSSFQLETVRTFHPNVSAILNLTPDHLNRHHTMDAYIDAKMCIAKNQTEDEWCVINREDELLLQRVDEIQANIFYFSSKRELSDGIYLKEDEIIYSNCGKKEVVIHTDDLQIFGRHNFENVMAAVAIAICLNVPMDCIRKALKAFKGVEHRIEYVTTKRGVKYYNDSKGTNPDAAIQAIKAMKTKTLLIAGGYDKGNEYDEWIEAFDGKVSYLVLLGQTREKIRDCAILHGIQNIVLVDSLKEAVDFCANHAKDGESVLLSPCCASWGMFKNYEERGCLFKQYAHALQE